MKYKEKFLLKIHNFHIWPDVNSWNITVEKHRVFIKKAMTLFVLANCIYLFVKKTFLCASIITHYPTDDQLIQIRRKKTVILLLPPHMAATKVINALAPLVYFR